MRVRSFLVSFRVLAWVIAGFAAVPVNGAVNANQITAVAERFLASHSAAVKSQFGDGVRIEAATDRIDSRLNMADCDVPLTAEERTQRLMGRINIQIRCDGSSPWTLYVPAEIRVYREIVVLVESVGRGAVLQRTDLSMREMDISQLNGSFYGSIEEVEGMVARRMLSAGKPLTDAVLELPVVVHRGDEVILTASGNGLMVRIPGEALADGQAGQQISVRNKQSNRVVEAEVTGPGQVEVAM